MAGKKSPRRRSASPKRSAKRSASPKRGRSPRKRTASPKRSVSRSASRGRKVNKWVRHVKAMSKKLGLSLKQAMQDGRVKRAYKTGRM